MPSSSTLANVALTELSRMEGARRALRKDCATSICARCSPTIRKRGERLAVEAEGFYFDYSKHRVTAETMQLLIELANESGLRDRIDAMFRGDKINVTEKRAVLHVALRAPRDATIMVDGKNVVPEVHEVLDRDGGLFQSRPQRRMDGPHRQARSAPSSISASAAPTSAR